MKTSKRKRWLSLLLAVIMTIGILPLSMSSASAKNDGSNEISTSDKEVQATACNEEAQVVTAVYPELRKLIEGKVITPGFRYKFYSDGSVHKIRISLQEKNYYENTTLVESLKKEKNLDRYVAYSSGILLYWTRYEDDFFDFSELSGWPLTLILFDNQKYSAIYAPGVDLKIRVTDDVNVTFRHSTRYKNKTGFCPKEGATGAVIDLAKSEGNLGSSGSFELCGYGSLRIITTQSPQKTSPDYAIVAKNTVIGEDAGLAISCGNKYRNVVSLIPTVALTIDTTNNIYLAIHNPIANAAAWGCHMNNLKILNAKKISVGVDRGMDKLIIFGNNGETDPVKVFKYYKNNGKIGSEWYARGNTDSEGNYSFTIDHSNDVPRLRYSLNNQILQKGKLVEGLEAGLGYEISADATYVPQWMQKLKDAGRLEFYFFVRLREPGTGKYEAAYLDDFYVDRTGRHTIEFVWICMPANDPDRNIFDSTRQLKDCELFSMNYLYYDVSYYEVLMENSVSGTRYIWNIKFQQDGGEFTEATKDNHRISFQTDTLSKCYTRSQHDIPSEWYYNSGSDTYTMGFWVYARHGYQFAGQVESVSGTVSVNVEHTEVSYKDVNDSNDSIYIELVAKRKLTEVRGTLKEFRLGGNTWYTEIVSDAPSKYKFKNTVVYEAIGTYGVEISIMKEDELYYVYFDIDPGYGYYLTDNTPIKVTLPEGYRANGMFDKAVTYNVIYKGDWYSYSPIIQKYRIENVLEANCEGKEYGINIDIKEPVLGDRPAANAGYAAPTRIPANTKVVSMQWLGPDGKPMGTYDKFEVGKWYTIDLKIAFEGATEHGHVYPKNNRDFVVNNKSANAWLNNMDAEDGFIWQLYDSYKVEDPNARGSVTGTVTSFNSNTDTVTVQLFKRGSSTAAYSTSVKGNSARYTLSGIAAGTYTMKVSKKNHVTREYAITVGTQSVTQNVKIHLKGDINGDGKVNTSDVGRANAHARGTSVLKGNEFICADINGDGRINTSDVGKINAHARGKDLLW